MFLLILIIDIIMFIFISISTAYKNDIDNGRIQCELVTLTLTLTFTVARFEVDSTLLIILWVFLWLMSLDIGNNTGMFAMKKPSRKATSARRCSTPIS